MDLADKLLSRIKISPDGCFEWQGARKGKTKAEGYGLTSWNGKAIKAHRASYLAFRGPIPDGLHVCHTCDNPCCINPAHLFLGTVLQNRRDSVDKGRAARGEGHGKARLTVKDVLAMRADHESGLSYAAIARKYGTRSSHTWAIVNRRLWKCVPPIQAQESKT